MNFSQFSSPFPGSLVANQFAAKFPQNLTNAANGQVKEGFLFAQLRKMTRNDLKAAPEGSVMSIVHATLLPDLMMLGTVGRVCEHKNRISDGFPPREP